MMPYLVAVAGFSSTLSFTTLTLPTMVPAISSSAGAIIRHGPHHSAQKSTTTGSLALSTSASKVESDTLPTPMGNLVFGRARPAPAESCPERRNEGGERQVAPPCRAGMKSLSWRAGAAAKHPVPSRAPPRAQGAAPRQDAADRSTAGRPEWFGRDKPVPARRDRARAA